jgi:ABC-type branched-subunit amino acid transport system ATPase component
MVEQNDSLVTQVAAMGFVLEVGNIVLEGEMKEMIINEIVKSAFLG